MIKSLKERYDHVWQIITDIEKGIRLHDQEVYTSYSECGTAHCITGWIVDDNRLDFHINSDLYWDIDIESEWIYGEKYLDIDYDDSQYLFDEDLTIAEIKQNFIALAIEKGFTYS